MPRFFHRSLTALLLGATFAFTTYQLRAEEPLTGGNAAMAGGWESAAKKLQQATSTVRIWTSASPADASGQAEKATAEKPTVVVCSGVCVREGQIITAALVGSDTRIRLTLPGGKQSDAQLQVIDEFSGLALLKADTTPLSPLACGKGQPAVGSGALTAAAWGLEPPIVSQGIIGGVDRTHPGASYPPLLQCDVRTMETSSGAAIVNRNGELLGIVVATGTKNSPQMWTYAVPVSHVERILRSADAQQGDGVVVLKRRRPVVGMVLDQDEDVIVVQRVTPDGPAAKAGIKPGDQILAADGVAIRSVYQAVLPTLYKQPGDTIDYRLQRTDGIHDVTVALGGGVELSSAPFDLLAGLVQPKIEVARDESGAYVARARPSNIRVVSSPPLPDDEPLPVAPTTADKLALLERALDRYRTVIELQQKQLADEQKKRHAQEELLQSLRTEMDALRKAIGAEKTP